MSLSTVVLAGVAGSCLHTISDVLVRVVKNSGKPMSLIDVVDAGRVEPLVLVDNVCANLDYSSEIMQSLLSIFSGYYLQAVAALGEVGGVEVIRVLDKLSPNRKFNIDVITDHVLGKANEGLNDSLDFRMNLENYKHKLPTLSNRATLPLEDSVTKFTDKDAINTAKENANLSVGKLLNVTIKKGGETVVFPISVRLLVNILNDKGLLNILAYDKEDTSFRERFHAWRSGRIRFIQDLILCQDLIKEQRKLLIEDKDGKYSDIVARVNNNRKAGFLTRTPSLNMASNIFVISKALAESIEIKFNGKFTDKRVRDKVFENSYAMIIVVVDTDLQRANFFYRDVNDYGSYSVRDLKSLSKSNDGGSIFELLKSFQGLSSPSF